MNKLILYFDHPDQFFNDVPTLLIFNNHEDAQDWFKKSIDCKYSYAESYFTIERYGRKTSGRHMWGKAYL